AVEARPRPDVAPRVARDEVLEVGRQLGLVRRRAVDVGVGEHLAAHRHALLVALAVGQAGAVGSRHRVASSKKRMRSAATAAGCSAGARWLASDTTAARPRRTPPAIASAWSGGETGSASPASASTGTAISPSRAVTSYVARASQHSA